MRRWAGGQANRSLARTESPVARHLAPRPLMRRWTGAAAAAADLLSLLLRVPPPPRNDLHFVAALPTRAAEPFSAERRSAGQRRRRAFYFALCQWHRLGAGGGGRLRAATNGRSARSKQSRGQFSRSHLIARKVMEAQHATTPTTTNLDSRPQKTLFASRQRRHVSSSRVFVVVRARVPRHSPPVGLSRGAAAASDNNNKPKPKF